MFCGLHKLESKNKIKLYILLKINKLIISLVYLFWDIKILILKILLYKVNLIL